VVAGAHPSRLRNVVGAVVSLPIVLPPTVLGFYLLIVMGPEGVGMLTRSLGLGGLPFTFAGLVVASVFYSLPFVVQPIQNAFMAMGARRWRWPPPCEPRRGSFVHVACPRPSRLHYGGHPGLCPYGGRVWRGADDWRQHPRKTRVLSVQIYNHVEAIEYGQAHSLAGLLVALRGAAGLYPGGVRNTLGAGR
jgi:molybdate transport system permease protein